MRSSGKSGDHLRPATAAKTSDQNTGGRRKAAVCVSAEDLQAMNARKG